MHLSVCTGDTVYDEVSSFNCSDGYVLKELRAVLASNCDLVVATIPHRFHGAYHPKEWVVVMHWDGIR